MLLTCLASGKALSATSFLYCFIAAIDAWPTSAYFLCQLLKVNTSAHDSDLSHQGLYLHGRKD